MMTAVVWPGTVEDYARLLASVASWCDCKIEAGYVCQSHLLLTDQDALNHLAFVYRQRERYTTLERSRSNP